MQTTLLTLGIALILALVTALVGPMFVDWGRFRTNFEAHASRLAGQPVRISGRIDVRLLPIPTVRLQGIDVGPPGSKPALSARELDAELSLPSLMHDDTVDCDIARCERQARYATLRITPQCKAGRVDAQHGGAQFAAHQ